MSYMCFDENFEGFVAGVKYKIKKETERFYIVGKFNVPKGSKGLYKISKIVQ